MKKLTVLTATLIALAGVAPGSLINPSFENPPVTGSFTTGVDLNVVPTGWSVTVTAPSDPRFLLINTDFSVIPTGLDGNQFMSVDTVSDAATNVGDRFTISQAVTGVAVGNPLRGSFLLTPYLHSGWGQTAVYGFYSDSDLTNLLGTAISVPMDDSKTRHAFVRYEDATYTVLGGEGTIYFGLSIETTTGGVRSSTAFDGAQVIIPEPASALLLGMAGLCLFRRRARG